MIRNKILIEKLPLSIIADTYNTNAKSKEKGGGSTGRGRDGDRPADAPLRTAPL